MDIEHLSPEELMELHRKIWRRLKELRRMKLYKELQKFEIGDKVSFKNKGDSITGTVVRVNQKSLTIRTSQGVWYVDPDFVTKIQLSEDKNSGNIYRGIKTPWAKN